MLDDFVGSVFGSVLGDRIRALFVDRKQLEGRAFSLFRLVAGEQPGFSSRWRSGNVRLSRMAVRFRGRTVRIVAVQLRVEPPSARETLLLVEPIAVVRLRTATAELDWIIRAKQADWALAALAPRDASGVALEARH